MSGIRELSSIKEKILDRALFLIGVRGTVNVPVRAIVEEAGVNIGAINYYFGTKDKMLSQVKRFYVNNIISTINPLINDSLDDQKKLIYYANEVMIYCLRFPGISVIYKDANETKNEDPYSQEIVDTTALMEEKLDLVLKRYINDDEENFRMKRMIFKSSIIYPSDNIGVDSNDDLLYDPLKRMKYIEKVVKLIKGKNEFAK